MPKDDLPKPADRAIRNGLSLRLRLMLTLLAVFGVIQVAMSVVHVVYMRRSADTLMNDRLGERLGRVISALQSSSFPLTSAGLTRLVGGEQQTILPDRSDIAVYDDTGTLVASNVGSTLKYQKSSVELALKSDSPLLQAIAADGPGSQPMHTAARRFTGPNNQPFVVVVASNDPFVASLFEDLIAHIVLTTPIWLLATAGVGWLVAGVAVRPLVRLGSIVRGMRPETMQDPINIGSSATELTKLQRELDDMQRRIETGYEAQQRFVANVSHEIKTPIATVLTEAQTLPKVADLPPDIQRFVDSTQDEMRRLGKLVESFLLLTRVRHGKPLETTTRAVSVNEVVMDSVQNCWKMATSHAVQLVPDLAPEDDRDIRVLGDPELLRTMLDNLVRNGIRFSPRDQIVKVLVRPNEHDVYLCVRDTGPGIPEALIEKIFDRFSQAKSEEKLGRGSGLGLEIAQGIAELHGGKISVSNLEAGGCEFCASLPLLEHAPAPAESTGSLTPARS